MEELSQKEKASIALAAMVVILSAISIGVFLYAGAGTIFYITAAISVILGFYITYSIAKREEPIGAKKK
ncbi:MAG: hypothetical protein KGH53_02760 [Candidatus Micrarchaeota archaeon]|nr:hypothetical protein [Candidatus Micrarchaeota archaeon]